MEDFFEEGAVESGNEEDNDYEEDEDSREYENDIGCEDVDVHDNKTENALKDAQDADDPTLVYLFHQSQSSERSDASDAIDMDADLKFDSLSGEISQVSYLY